MKNFLFGMLVGKWVSLAVFGLHYNYKNAVEIANQRNEKYNKEITIKHVTKSNTFLGGFYDIIGSNNGKNIKFPEVIIHSCDMHIGNKGTITYTTDYLGIINKKFTPSITYQYTEVAE